MLTKLNRRAGDEKGFTLIELLVVILIIGILAAIAIPAFLNQRNKAYDSAAKSNLRTAATAEETYATDNNGAYPASTDTSSATDSLVKIEPTLNNKPKVTGGAITGGYALTSTSLGNGGDVFTYQSVNGVVTRSCSGSGGGCPNLTW
jgi:type IV pilus assembly protein PilA